MALLWAATCGSLLSEAAAGSRSAPSTIVFDLRPFQVPAATYLRINETGEVEGFRYSPARLVVMHQLSGFLMSEEVSVLFDAARSASVQRALDRSYAGDGLLRGDQFALSISDRATVGFVNETPPPLRRVIDDIIEISKQLSESAAHGAFVRSEVIDANRLARIRKRGTIQFISYSDPPSGLDTPLRQAASDPGTFIELPDGALEVFLSCCAEGREIYLLEGQRAYQFVLFRDNQ